MAGNVRYQPTAVQSSFSTKIEKYLKDKGVGEVNKILQPGRDSGVIKIAFKRLAIFVYDDGGAEILSSDRIDRIFIFIPVRIDWRFEIGQYSPQKRLESEFFKWLDEAIELDAKSDGV